MSLNFTHGLLPSRVSTTEQPYIFTIAPFKRFLNDIISGSITNYSITDLFQDDSTYVTKAMFFPFNLTMLFDYTLLSNSSVIYLGKKDVSASSYVSDAYNQVAYISGNTTTANAEKWFEISVSRNFNNFLDFNPYTKIFIQVPFFGRVEINPIDAYKGTITGYLMVDIRTGYATLYLQDKDDVTIETKRTKVAVDISIGKTNAEEIQRNNLLQSISLISQIGMVAASAASGNAVSSGVAIGIASKTASDMINNNVSRLTSVTSGGDGRDLQVQDTSIYVIIEQPQNIKAPSKTLKGGVYNQNSFLNSLHGYTEIGEIHFNPSNNVIYDDETNEIIQLLRNGVIL